MRSDALSRPGTEFCFLFYLVLKKIFGRKSSVEKLNLSFDFLKDCVKHDLFVYFRHPLQGRFPRVAVSRVFPRGRLYRASGARVGDRGQGVRHCEPLWVRRLPSVPRLSGRVVLSRVHPYSSCVRAFHLVGFETTPPALPMWLMSLPAPSSSEGGPGGRLPRKVGRPPVQMNK